VKKAISQNRKNSEVYGSRIRQKAEGLKPQGKGMSCHYLGKHDVLHTI
jgi:hypothetical protein